MRPARGRVVVGDGTPIATCPSRSCGRGDVVTSAMEHLEDIGL
jgi:hypothetical protein